MAELSEIIATGDRRNSLIALRDFLAHELEGNRCSKCRMSQLRTGDMAALVLRLDKIMEEIAALPVPGEETESELGKLRASLSGKPDASRIASAGLGTKSGPRRQGGRRTGGDGGSAS